MDKKNQLIKDNFVDFLDNITSNSLMDDYKNEIRTKTEHLPQCHQKCRRLSYCHC